MASCETMSQALSKEGSSKLTILSGDHHQLSFSTFKSRHVHERAIGATCILHFGLHPSAHFRDLDFDCKRGETAYFHHDNPARLRHLGIHILDISGVCKIDRLATRPYISKPGLASKAFLTL